MRRSLRLPLLAAAATVAAVLGAPGHGWAQG
jgi:hypothetical protein